MLLFKDYERESHGHRVREQQLQTQLQDKLKITLPKDLNINLTWIYFVSFQKPLQDDQIATLGSLLQAELWTLPSLSWKPKDHAISFCVTPRTGTISPWSSKATDIAHLCGFNSTIERVERGWLYTIQYSEFDTSFLQLHEKEITRVFQSLVVDKMTQSCYFNGLPTSNDLFGHAVPRSLAYVPLCSSDNPLQTLEKANQARGLALAQSEMEYLVRVYRNELQRDPTDVELMMFAQINSEHCRHKVFNATWSINDQPQSASLFDMIRLTYQTNSKYILSAYKDNAAVLQGIPIPRFAIDPTKAMYTCEMEEIHLVCKVETHNHPTAVSPFPGAATGSGGEIRDEGSVGQGSKSKAGLMGLTLSNLSIPNLIQPWDFDPGKPDHMASPLEILIQAPLGSAAFNNEFGRPTLTGYFRTFCMPILKNEKSEVYGYHKPIMLAGGLGSVRPMHVHKQPIQPNQILIVLGGPSMLIGLGGGAASSVTSGTSSVDLDFASVQRENPEMQRRCQMVIDACTAMGSNNPIVSIHDVGAGGLSNALPELVHEHGLGALIQLRSIPSSDPSMSPLEIWCNESQERYVLAIDPESRALFESLCRRERCTFASVGVATLNERLVIYDSVTQLNCIDVPMSVLFGKSSKTHRSVQFNPILPPALEFPSPFPFDEAVNRVLQLPCVASKSFLITIGDRFVGGLTVRDQMVGPWQIPVADAAMTSTSFDTFQGEAMALGERPVLALVSHEASARMAVAEALQNLSCASITSLEHVRLSANWMACVDAEGEGGGIYKAVEAITLSFCTRLGITIPVGKDSLSMRARWSNRSVTSPLSVNITAYASVCDVRNTWTPQLVTSKEDTVLVLLATNGLQVMRLGGSALAQVYSQVGNSVPDCDNVLWLQSFWNTLQAFKQVDGLVLAYHDRSDGGLLTTLAEMCFAGRVGVSIQIPPQMKLAEFLFNEELGAVIQVPRSRLSELEFIATQNQFPATHLLTLGNVLPGSLEIALQHGDFVRKYAVMDWFRLWSSTSYHVSLIRDNPVCVDSELKASLNENDSGLFSSLSFPYPTDLSPFAKVPRDTRPRVAILREQGVNSFMEMAWSFDAAGFCAVDVHMTDLLSGQCDLNQFVGLAACGGFSYGDVLGAGRGWALSILQHSSVRNMFLQFFARTNTFTLGICNGCQMISQLKSLLPVESGAASWPQFIRNQSNKFESRTCLVKVRSSNSIFFRNMENTVLPIPVAHGEGRVFYPDDQKINQLVKDNQVALQYIDHQGQPTEQYPYNPNGSALGVTGITTKDGRVTILMPHPERASRWIANSWIDSKWKHDQVHGPWLQMFTNARAWVEGN
jgi:phosphoribosylformylglycinamidine synthase